MVEKGESTVNRTVFDAWWNVPKENLIRRFRVDPERGLSGDQVIEYRNAYGSNVLEEIRPTRIIELIIEGAKEPMMILLLSIAGLSFLFGKPVEAVVMLFVVAAYISVEFINKYRSDRTMERLREMTQPTTKVVRDGKGQEIPTTDAVTGDIVVLSEGTRIPADLRLLESFGLLVNEAPLTGESLPVRKDAGAEVSEDTALAERLNCCFSGTTVLTGEGKGIVLAVGSRSEIGAIAREVQARRKERTFIQEAMTRLAKTLAVLAIIVSLLIPAIGFLRGLNLQEMVLTWLALTFLMIPGQPPVIIAMALALGSFELARNNLVVKRLQGVEVLGQVSVIMTDKTGTVTENRMRVERFILGDGREVKPSELPEDLRTRISLCLPRYSNDPTDKAVSESLDGTQKAETYTRLESFSEGRPWRTLFYERMGKPVQAIAGEPERLLNAAEIQPGQKEVLREILRDETNKGSRVVAFAFKESSPKGEPELTGSRLLALAVLSDPVRKGVPQAVAALEQAGIITYLVTGDHPATAGSVARAINLKQDVLKGSDLEKMDDAALEGEIHSVRIFARISPSQKQRLVSLLKRNETVAVIGDGVNDAPALRTASVGIAMGEIGTDLAKETADLVLTDDNYIHLPQAIGLGRKALDNFRKGLTYYLSAKAILLSIFLVPLALGIPFPFAPLYIILTELLMDLASSTIFVTETAEPDVLNRKPQRIANFLDKAMALRIFRNGFLLASGILGIYLWFYYTTHDLVLARTAAFVTWLLGHVMLALNLKQEKTPLLKQGIFSNRFGTFWLAGMILLSLMITMIPFFRTYLNTAALSPGVWLAVVLVALGSTWWIEAIKTIRANTEPE